MPPPNYGQFSKDGPSADMNVVEFPGIAVGQFEMSPGGPPAVGISLFGVKIDPSVTLIHFLDSAEAVDGIVAALRLAAARVWPESTN